MQRSWVRACVAVVLVVAFGQGIAAPPATAAAPPPAPAVAPAHPYAGSPFTVRATVPGRFVRTVKLLTWDGSKFVTSGVKKTAASGAFTFAHASPASSAQVRVWTGAAKHKGRSYPAVVTRTRVVSQLANAVSLTAPPTAKEGRAFVAAARLTPAVAGRRLHLERRSDTSWTDVATATSTADGAASFTALPARSLSGQQYRVRVEAVGPRPAVTSATVVVDVSALEHVARLTIDTDEDAPISSKEEYVRGVMRLDPRDSGVAAFELPARLRVRGNGTSYALTKLSYKVKLDAKASLAGFPASKDWGVFANFYDRSMLRTDVEQEASRRIGLPWTPRMRFVEVVLNGKLQGLYQLGENVEKAADRVSLPKAGVLLEGDFRDEDDPHFRTSRGLQLYLKDPDDGGDALTAQVAAGVQEAEDSLYGEGFADPDTGYRSHLDVDSFVDWYLVNELMKTYDGSFNASIWMSWVDDKVAMAAPWDFDLSAGNRTEFQLGDPTGAYLGRNWWSEAVPRPYTMMPGGHWLTRLVQDPWFQERVQERWAAAAPALRTLPAYVQAQGEDIALAAERNFADPATGGAGQFLGPTLLENPQTAVFHGSWPAERDALADWIDARVAWMDSQLGSAGP